MDEFDAARQVYHQPRFLDFEQVQVDVTFLVIELNKNDAMSQVHSIDHFLNK